MPTPTTSDALVREAHAAFRQFGDKQAAANALGITRSAMRRRVAEYEVRFGVDESKVEFSVTPLPDDDIDVEDLVKIRIKQFAKKRAYENASRLIGVKVNIKGPIGLLHFGDPHVDDDGTDLELLRKHSDLTKIEGIWGANVGDTTNNWVGRLARLYANQSTSSAQAWKLADWFITRTRWLYMIGGNHDAWSGSADPLRWIAKQEDTLYKPSECRIGLNFPNGRQVVINARHDFSGSSMWNPAHAQMKAAQLGFRDHISVSGHKHCSGYGVIKDASTGRVCHAVQVASYKLYDSFAKEKGFRDQTLSAACMTVINPELDESHPDMIKMFWCPEEGADFLKWKRSKVAK